MPELDPYGYVQEEYLVSGTVDGQPYSTSLLVRKPRDPSKFSGLVAVETIHAAGAIPFWGTGREVWAPGGHAWVAVASQRAALEGQVKKFNPKRYGALSVPEVPGASQPAPQPGAQPAPPNPAAAGAQDRISQAIVSQIGAMLKSNPANGPLKGMRVRYLLLGGSSQTGGTTWRYLEQSHATARLADGKPIFDGYFPAEAFAAAPLSGGDAAVVNAVTEGDLVNALSRKRPLGERADSDSAKDRFRHYIITGASHVPTRGQPRDAKTGEYPSQFPSSPFFKQSLQHLVNWVTRGVVPPKGPRIEVANGEIVRDQAGNAKGGIRSPYVDVPTVRYLAAKNGLTGTQEPIPADKLKAMYGSRAQYLQRFNASLDKAVAGRWISRQDAAKLKSEEAKNPPF
jgi:hypothetical protein